MASSQRQRWRSPGVKKPHLFFDFTVGTLRHTIKHKMSWQGIEYRLNMMHLIEYVLLKCISHVLAYEFQKQL